MTRLHLHRLVASVMLLPAVVLFQSCNESDPVETISVSLKNGDVYQYPTVSGDEAGARIATQASHYSISEIRRNAATNWAAGYVYQPAPGFVGSDHAELEILTGSDGASPPTRIQNVAFRFVIHD